MGGGKLQLIDARATRQQVLSDTLQLLESAVRKCSATKRLRGALLWRVALAARAARLGRAAAQLVESGLASEARLQNRALYDTVVDMNYLAADPLKNRVREQQLHIEIAIDRYERLKYKAEAGDDGIAGFLQRYPELQGIRDNYDRAKKDPLYRAHGRRSDTEKRWARISASEKEKAVPDFDSLAHYMSYPIRIAGNATAHNRPITWTEHVFEGGDKELRVRVVPTTDFTGHSDMVRFLTNLLVLMAADFLVDQFYLGKRWDKRTQRMLDRIRSLPKIKLDKTYLI